ncbi:uncharacterized protein LOC115667595 [Syzygium oleosum]|uniref:uncharacterized protein LOC115667595 n=1 Tax=Syzygium oleosum TaxID=219896 RepID=UPI0024B8BA7A|nr:uncharacterized protein LOC115667595 [Syzygium oleosum]
MGLRKISLLAVVCFALLVSSNAEEQESEQERRPIKTFKTIYGEIIDCIDIYKQPAFDHPLLKDHKLQKKPSFSLNATKHGQRAQVKLLEISHALDGCPDGTIPILRRTKEDRIRAKLLEQTHPQIYHPSSVEFPGLRLWSGSNPFHGAKAFIDNYIPKCANGQSSAALLRIASRITGGTNIMQTGWTVYPDLYKDSWSHFFIYWQAGATGCYDLMCPGFVQVDHSITLGQVLPESSSYGGQQFEIQLTIDQDLTTNNWWLIVETANGTAHVGYWPAELLPEMKDGAEALFFGGGTSAFKDMPFPPMGSGYFPDKSFSHACYIRQIHYTDRSKEWKVPESWQVSTQTSSKDCYGVAVNDDDDYMGYTLLFGGPGGYCGA